MDKIRIEILYFAELRKITKKENEFFELSNGTLEELLNLIFKEYEDLQNLIWDEKTQKIHNLISLIINNQAIHEKDPSSIHLNNKDTIAFLLPVPGG